MGSADFKSVGGHEYVPGGFDPHTLPPTITMEYEKAINILKHLPYKYPLDNTEKEAVTTALGLLSLGALAKNKIKVQAAKRKKSTEW